MASRATWSLLLVLLLPLAACSRATLKSSVVDRHGGTDEFEELDFWDALSLRRMVTNDDALHALLLTFGGTAEASKATDYQARLKAAYARGWLREGYAPPRNETARVGWIAKAVTIECKIEGGLTMRVFGKSERYAVKELNYRKWLPEMSEQQAISGPRLIALLSKAEDHQEGAGERPKEDL